MLTCTFHLSTPALSRLIQNECNQFPDLATALAEAQRVGRRLIRQRVRRKICKLRGSLDIRDERDHCVARIPLADLISQMS